MTTQTEPTTTAHPLTPGMRLDLVASEADVELFFDRTTPEAEVVITASEPASLEHSVKTSRSDDRLEVVVPPLLTAGPEKGFALQIGRFSLSLGHTAGVTVEVHLPAGSPVRVDGGSGDLRLEGRPGTVQLDTSSGDITVGVVAGCRSGRSSRPPAETWTTGSARAASRWAGHRGCRPGSAPPRETCPCTTPDTPRSPRHPWPFGQSRRHCPFGAGSPRKDRDWLQAGEPWRCSPP